MKYTNEFKNSKFELFYKFIKNDGLVPKKSERLHKKKIYSNLMNNQKMTLENFEDYLVWDKKESIKSIIGEEINYKKLNGQIIDVSFEDNDYLKIHMKEGNILIQIKDFADFKKLASNVL
ncbi:hypothetical protein LPB137_00535 [Poseidonibacter parvus]|uniref:Uncharacterized protein n=1 Tax=Poseidonibacter parvus TaxID=1850254 RepID=A0A1P8KIQ4_9BACT|nr:hypothetical protein [Poseidonibacter parvus]APW64422.1 hypothetical protein LPB137_00535 [Poseidonibacter parvus]